jgi:putative ABC transport system substrate-binding protein
MELPYRRTFPFLRWNEMTNGSRRRRVLVTLGATLIGTGARLARAQTPATARIAWLSPTTKSGTDTPLAGWLAGMADLGYAPGRNLDLHIGWGMDSFARTDRAANELAALEPALMIAQGPALYAAKKLQGNMPVIFAFSGDPLEAGVVRSFARPGGRFTGLSFLAMDLVAKRVDILHELLPGMRRLAVISSPNHPGDTKELSVTRDAGKRYQLEVSHHLLQAESDVGAVLRGVAEARPDAVVVHPNSGMMRHVPTFARFSVERRMPMISAWAEFAEGGNLFSYGPRIEEGYRRLAYFVDRVLRGTAPAELPVELPRSVEFVINLDTAKALGLSLPEKLLVRADRMIG